MQEIGAPEWDVRETGELTVAGMVTGVLVALAIYGLLRLVAWQLERRRESVPWVKLRLWVPTGMLATGIILFALLTYVTGWLVDGLLFGWVVLNAPAALLAGAIGGIFDPPTWAQVLITGMAVWGTNYGLVRAAEWRAWSRVPVSLNLKQPTQQHDEP